MEPASAAFIENNISDNTLNVIYNKLMVEKSAYKNYLTSPSDYAEPVVTDQEILDDILGDNEFFQQNFGTGSVKPSTSVKPSRLTISQEGSDGFGYVLGLFDNNQERIGQIVFRSKTYLKEKGYPIVNELHLGFEEKYQGKGYFQDALIELLNYDDSPIFISNGRVINDNVFKAINKLDTSKLNITKLEDGFIITLNKQSTTTQPSTQNQLNNQRNIAGTLRVDLGGFSIDNVSEEAYNNLLHATADPFYKGLREWISKFKKTLKPFAVVDSSEIIEKYTKELATQPSTSIKPRIDTSREWRGDLESRPVYTAEGINTMRTTSAKTDEHFGNPFSEAGYGNTIKVASIGAAVRMYKDWLLNNAVTESEIVKGSVSDLDKFDNQRAWILDQINQGKLDGATLLYAGKSEARGEGMHPTALAEVVEQLRPAQPTAQNIKSVMNTSTEAISDFYNGLTEEQKNKLGNLDALIEEYEDIPFDQAVEDYIETLKCKL